MHVPGGAQSPSADPRSLKRPPDAGQPDPTRNCVCSTLRFSPLPCQAKRRGTNDTSSDVRPAKLRASPKQTTGTASPRPPGTVLSVPSIRRHCTAHHCQPGFIHAARPRRRRPAPPSHRRCRPLSASFPNRRVPKRTGTCPRQARPSRALPAGGMRHIPCLRVRCASRRMRNAARSRSHSPCAAAAVARRPPVSRLRPPSPGDTPRPAS